MQNDIIKNYCQAIKNKLAQSDSISAMGIADKLVYNFPNCEKGYYYRAVCFFALYKYNEAISNYQIALRINPYYAKAYFNIGTCYYEMKEYDYALINFGKALILFSNQGNRISENKVIDAIKLIVKERNS